MVEECTSTMEINSDKIPTSNIINEGSTIIIYLGYNNLHVLKVKQNETFQMKFGALKHNDIIGKRYGSKIMCSKGYIHVLAPEPELWTLALPHRTQILYMPDISLVILELDIKPGSIVIEAGTGSGSLSHSIIRSIKPNGHLHTFEFHELRSNIAKTEFEEHGLADFVTAYHRDVLRDGFLHENIADAVFLDLPAPWDAIEHVIKVMKKTGGRLCTFSPCIEQVQRTCQRLRACGFEEISTIECLRRTHEFKYQHMPKIRFTSEQEQKEENEEEETKSPSKRHCNEANNEEKNGMKVDLDGSQKPKDIVQMITAVGPPSMAGHTGFLTFSYIQQLS
ncbi:unnamed protein product [Didymodactylos carnosus]|uniref:tRNA (adenine(58)-N(1))-methyltransferase catalytic subunit TRMT61A n=1 Tax=Didymodactylos carnosus TaxID=1234261 RepID=A0A815LNN0_9BILA|nr:unnamed protein product [Didymodactylos carnosus]CAF1408397.1 unnamed protein product [Didymodactylos carnosus]CAF3875823.1 unnamed protein product [Didymodactylos carnosus]CAF4298443.1 unnamed protein product [Didymodactylos carnosus]